MRASTFVLIGSVVGLLLSASVLMAQVPPPAKGYVGTQACRECHDSYYRSYMQTSHGIKEDKRTPEAKFGCETCHGPGAEHVREQGGEVPGNGAASGGAIQVLGPKSKLSVEERNAVCLSCHETMTTKVALWHGSPHESRSLACTSCHSIHGGHPKNLAKPTEVEVCTTCHQSVKAEIHKNSHHPVREGRMTCTSCHNPHGTVTDKLIAANSINEKCYECHTEKRGPFLWEHPPVTENCTTCHTPHGSSHPKLLAAKTPFLCQSCHSNSRHPGTLYALSPQAAAQGLSAFQALNNRAFYRGCLNCHSQIHGSNHPSGKSLGR
jgi:DmsE family decaheme c-type cytochrome